jgi:hypothetical protein
MARDTRSIVKMSRREGYALHPKAHKALVKRSGPSGSARRTQPAYKTKPVRTAACAKSKKLRGFTDF